MSVFHSPVSAQPATAADHLAQKSQLDAATALAVARANHTGTQPTATIDGLQAFVDARLQTVVDAAPAALDTLNELAAALGDDPNFAATVNGQLGALDTRIDTLEGSAGAGVHKATVGDATVSSFVITHNLGTLDVDVVVRRLSDGQRVFPVDKAASANTVSVDFGTFVPPVDSHRVLVRAF